MSRKLRYFFEVAEEPSATLFFCWMADGEGTNYGGVKRYFDIFVETGGMFQQ